MYKNLRKNSPKESLSGSFDFVTIRLRGDFCVFHLFTTFRADEENIYKQSKGVHRRREDENALIAARLVYDYLGDLVARQACNRPRRKGDAVQGGDTAHTVNVGKKGGKVTKPAAVTKVDDNQQGNANNGNFARNCACREGKYGQSEFAD